MLLPYLVPSCLALYKMVHFVEREARMQQRLSEQNAGPSIGFQRRVAQISINHKDWVARVSTLRTGKARKLQSGNITPDKSALRTFSQVPGAAPVIETPPMSPGRCRSLSSACG